MAALTNTARPCDFASRLLDHRHELRVRPSPATTTCASVPRKSLGSTDATRSVPFCSTIRPTLATRGDCPSRGKPSSFCRAPCNGALFAEILRVVPSGRSRSRSLDSTRRSRRRWRYRPAPCALAKDAVQARAELGGRDLARVRWTHSRDRVGGRDPEGEKAQLACSGIRPDAEGMQLLTGHRALVRHVVNGDHRARRGERRRLRCEGSKVAGGRAPSPSHCSGRHPRADRQRRADARAPRPRARALRSAPRCRDSPLRSHRRPPGDRRVPARRRRPGRPAMRAGRRAGSPRRTGPPG